jgi:hypothetical protein
MSLKHSKTETRYGAGLTLATTELSLTLPTTCGLSLIDFRSPRNRVGNVFVEFPATAKRSPAGYRFRGGHRLWHTPEHAVRSYLPDDEPIACKPLKNGLAIAQPLDASGLQKAIKLEFPRPATLRLTHALTNQSLWPIHTGPWAITMLRPGGYGIVPFLPKGDHSKGDYLPNAHLVPWSYTDLSGPEWKIHTTHLGIDTSQVKKSQKLGFGNYPGWSAYWLDGATFVKYAHVIPGATYPDMGCSFETFMNPDMFELETLAPPTTIEPGASALHIEHWTIINGLKRPDNAPAFTALATVVASWLKTLRAGKAGAIGQ